jgi:hypothetical protein
MNKNTLQHEYIKSAKIKRNQLNINTLKNTKIDLNPPIDVVMM